MKTRYVLSGLVMYMLVAFPGSGLAQSAGQDGNPTGSSAAASTSKTAQEAEKAANLSLEELANVEVYSASKELQRASEAPSSVTVVTRDEIQRYGYRTLADILRAVRGFYVTYDRNYSYLGVRGFGRLGDWNSRVLLLVDGHRTNNNIFGQAMLGSEFPVDVDLIDRVEIVRGPSSSLYGSYAFLAVINVVTRKAPQLAGWELSFDDASFGSRKGRASYGGSYKGAEFMLSGTFYNSQGETLFFPTFDRPATNNGIVRNGDDEAYEHILANISWRDFTLQGLFSSREKGTPNAYFGTLFNDPRTRNFDDHQYFDLSYRHPLGGRWRLEARTSYDQYRLVAPLAVAPPTQGGSTGVDQFSDRGNWWTTEIGLNRPLGESHKLTLGFELRDNLRQDQGNFISATNTYEQDLSSTWIWGLYAQDDYAITAKLSLTGGLRYDRYPRGTVYDMVSGQPVVTTVLTSFGGTANPRLALIYHPYEKTTLKLLYGSAFRAPEIFETNPDLGSFVEDNQALRPETIKSIEAAAEQMFGPYLQLSGSVFHNRVSDLITLQPDDSDGLLVYANSQRLHATGAEVELALKSPSGVQGAMSLSLVDADNLGSGDTALSNSPGEMVKANLSVPLAHKQLFASLEGQVLGPRRTLAGNTLGSFQVFNATLFGHALGRHLEMSASVYNLLNKKYGDPGRPEDPEDAISQDGITFRIHTTLRF